MTEYLDSAEACVDHAIATVGKNIVLGAPLGLGKPVQILNAFFRRACDDPSINLLCHCHSQESTTVKR